MGKTVGEVRNMVVAGELLSKDVFNVLLAQTESINADFEKMPLTLDRAMSRVDQNFTRLLDSINDSSDATEGLANLIDDVATALGVAADYIASGELDADFTTWIDFYNDISDVADNLSNLLEWFNTFDQVSSQSAAGFSDVLLDFPVWASAAFSSIVAYAEYAWQWITSNYNILDLNLGKVWVHISSGFSSAFQVMNVIAAEVSKSISYKLADIFKSIGDGAKAMGLLEVAERNYAKSQQLVFEGTKAIRTGSRAKIHSDPAG